MREAAEALSAHDALRECGRREPAEANADAWLAWHEHEYRPAYDRWDNAMSALALALGEPDMSRHPFNFRPRCEAILSQ